MGETRAARVLAIMAGNGFFLDRIADVWLKDEGKYNLNSGANLRVFVALVAISLAYVSLFGTPRRRWSVVLELCAALGFVVSAAWWLYIADTSAVLAP